MCRRKKEYEALGYEVYNVTNRIKQGLIPSVWLLYTTKSGSQIESAVIYGNPIPNNDANTYWNESDGEFSQLLYKANQDVINSITELSTKVCYI
jgi:hypothetical protein